MPGESRRGAPVVTAHEAHFYTICLRSFSASLSSRELLRSQIVCNDDLSSIAVAVMNYVDFARSAGRKGDVLLHHSKDL